MADPDQDVLLQRGVKTWNSWRHQTDVESPDLKGANLAGRDLREVDFSNADLRGALLAGAQLSRANLSGAKLGRADLSRARLHLADLTEANLNLANLQGADLTAAEVDDAYLGAAYLVAASCRNTTFSRSDLTAADLSMADLSGADLTSADLTRCTLVETNLTNATVTGCRVYGISAWNICLKGAVQKDLFVTKVGEPNIQVDRLELAQFIHLLLNNSGLRNIIDTITSKVVLILGRFSPERKMLLDGLRNCLRGRDYVPVIFDFEKPSNRDLTETVSLLAHMSRFMIADLTDARSIPQELMTIIPNMPTVPVQPLLLATHHEYSMFEHFKAYPWVLPIAVYNSEDEILSSIEQTVLAPAEAKLRVIRNNA